MQTNKHPEGGKNFPPFFYSALHQQTTVQRPLDKYANEEYLGGMARDIFKLPNLISMGRLILLFPTAYFLSQPGPTSRIYALACLSAAAISDYLDGYFARKFNQKTELGKILDPLSDKILAGVLVILLIIYRAFPVEMAVLITGRDLLILSGGLIIRSKTNVTPQSNLTGKYCFASIAVLLISYVIEFDFGIKLLSISSVILITLSIFIYGRIFILALQGKPCPVFSDRPLYRFLRTGAAIIISAIYLYQLMRYTGWV